jgi:hypothetical protein
VAETQKEYEKKVFDRVLPVIHLPRGKRERNKGKRDRNKEYVFKHFGRS